MRCLVTTVGPRSSGYGQFGTGDRSLFFGDRVLCDHRLPFALFVGHKAFEVALAQVERLAAKCFDALDEILVGKNGAHLCVHSVGPESIRFGDEAMRIYRARGTALPLFKGAGSHAILAHLLPHQIRALYLANATEIAAAGLGHEWKDFRTALAKIRKAGYAMTIGQINPNMLSLSVPVFSDGKVQGSLLLLTVNTTEEKSSADRLAGELTQLAARIEKLMSEDASLE